MSDVTEPATGGRGKADRPPEARSAARGSTARRPSRKNFPRGLVIIEYLSWALWGGAFALAGHLLSEGAFVRAVLAGLAALLVALIRDAARDYARDFSEIAEMGRRYEFSKGFREGFARGVAFEKEQAAGAEDESDG